MSDIKSFNQISPAEFIINVDFVDRNIKQLTDQEITKYNMIISLKAIPVMSLQSIKVWAGPTRRLLVATKCNKLVWSQFNKDGCVGSRLLQLGCKYQTRPPPPPRHDWTHNGGQNIRLQVLTSSML